MPIRPDRLGDNVRVLVTGTAGFVGSHLSERLIADGHEVVGIDSFTSYYDRDQKLANIERLRDCRAFSLIEESLLDVDLASLLDGVEIVYHQAAQPGVRASWGRHFETYTRDNVLATQRLLEAVRNLPLRKFVYASSSSVYGDAEAFPTSEETIPRPVSPYGVTKLAAEHLVHLYGRNFGVPGISLRYFTVYGPRQRPDMAFHRFIRRGLTGAPIQVFGDGEQTRDFTFVDDVVAANVAAGFSDVQGQVFNIGGGSQASINQILGLVSTLLERPLDIHYMETEHGDVRHTAADTRLARQLLGFCPQSDLACGLEAEVQWLVGLGV